ncbi:hypothetical protein [Mycolicibacterium aubagnense]|uniref:Uncharacterized protein n=1 Tax=Mycolicibacterium aubagnense TaxID=319707 RepID=A0ABM7IHC9_9MYCO|nr:hypothetical protein [Mycolicibacterium aubagnense]WGI32338.1 hypothetical protein QDT91_24700 [Mycolicibacterium aubagnense]BBX86093.1 hypothetical protein MAUB_39660 [Mycolicibacterium aubagnense]
MKSSHAWMRFAAAGAIVLGAGVFGQPSAEADPDAPAPVDASASVQSTGVTSAGADPAAVAACSQFASALDNAADGYGAFADDLENNDPYIGQSNAAGRSSLQTSAKVAMDAANTPGLSPEIADPMRSWSVGAAKLFVKMGIGMTGSTLDSTATEVNTNAEAVQRGCAAAGTHA